MSKFGGFLFLLAGLLAMAASARADYFWDQNFLAGAVRTEYALPNEGTESNPLRFITPQIYPCADPILIWGGCETAPAVFANSHYWQARGGGFAVRYWTLVMNNEPWWFVDEKGRPLNTGPPDAALPRAVPGHGIMGFLVSSIANEPQQLRAHLAVSHTFPNPINQNALPFLAIHADARRGNGGPPGMLNNPLRPHWTEFEAKVWEYLPPAPDGTGAMVFWLYALAEWGGTRRGVFIDLFSVNINITTPHSAGGHSHWNWAIAESMYFPGADWAYIEAGDIARHCPALAFKKLDPHRQARRYRIDWQQVYRCASDNDLFDTPMPENETVPLTAIGWAVELTGDGVALWVSVEDMRMFFPLIIPPSIAAPSLSAGIAMPEDEASNEIRSALTASCRASPACLDANEAWLDGRERQRVPGDYSPRARTLWEASPLFQTP